MIFCSPEPISAQEIQDCLGEMYEALVPITDVENAIQELVSKYEVETYPFGINAIADGYQFLTKPAFQKSISIHLKQKSKRKLSTSALETLAIVAYKQPVTKGEIEAIRGVNSDYTVHKLLEKELLEVRGKAESIGKPLLYGTSPSFMDYLGIKDLSELPVLKDFEVDEENSIGEEPDIVVNEEA